MISKTGRFDMGTAWSDAVAMVRMNKDVVSVVAGVFFFLPFLALLILVPPPAGLEAAASDQEKMREIVNVFLLDNWIAFLAFSVTFLVGSLSMTSLLGRKSDPTVANAIKIGLVSLIPFAGCMTMLYAFEYVLSSIGELILGRLGIAVVELPLAVALLAIVIVVRIRLVMTGPIMTIEHTINPLQAMQRSWKLVKGHTRQIFGFLFLIGVAATVVSILLLFVISLLAAIVGGGAASMWIEAILSSMLISAIMVLIIALFAAIHRQLSRTQVDPPEREPGRFRP